MNEQHGMEHVFAHTSRVRYSETGPDARMKLSALVGRMQDCSVFHSLSIGRGPREWRTEQVGWMIMNWRIRMDRMPALGETVTTKTWGYAFNGIRGRRNFQIEDADGQVVAQTDSLWIYYDLAHQKPTRVPAVESEGYGTWEMLPGFEDLPRKLPLPEGEGARQEAIGVTHAMIDTNHHLNNLYYIDMAAAFLPEDFRPREMHVDYLRQVMLGETLYPLIWKTEAGCFISLENEDHAACANLDFRV